MPAPCSASTLKRLAWCKMGNGKKSIFDPRAGLWILIAANIIAFSDHIREEIGHIRDAMKLRNIRGLSRLECTVMPLMVSATETAEELSAAAVTRGIENPARKTSAVSLRLMPADLTGMLLVLALLIGSFVVQ